MPAWSGLFDDVFSDGPHSLQINKPSVRKKLAHILRRRSARVISEKLTTLLADATPASTASVSYSRVQHTPDPGNSVVHGGVATVESVSLVNAAVTAGDVTDLSELFEGGDEQITAPSDGSGTESYPVDASGNGGGGRLNAEYAVG